MNADRVVDDKFKAGQAHPCMGQILKCECPFGVTNIHTDLERQGRHFRKVNHLDIEVLPALVDKPRVTFSARYGDIGAVAQLCSGIAAAHHGWDTEFAGDDCCVAGAPTSIGDDRCSAFHDRFPVRVGHVSHQDIASLHLS